MFKKYRARKRAELERKERERTLLQKQIRALFDSTFDPPRSYSGWPYRDYVCAIDKKGIGEEYMTDFKPGDEVKATYQGIVRRITSLGRPEVETSQGYYIYPDPQEAKIEVLKKIDTIGTIRYGTAPGTLWVKITDKEWLFTDGKFYKILDVKDVDLTDKDNPPAGHLW